MDFVLTVIIQCVVAFCATLAFSMLFSVPKKFYLFCGLTGMAGWLCYFLTTSAGVSQPMASLFAAICLAIIARLFAPWCKCPATIFLISGIFPLVPGAGIYYTAYYFIMGNNSKSLENGILTIKIAVAIAIGIVLVLGIPSNVFKAVSPKRFEKK